MPTYIRLTDYKDSDSKEQGFFKSENRYVAKQEDFAKIPGSPVAYWVSDRVKEIFEKSEKFGDIAEPRQGMATNDNSRFLRFWNEVSCNKLGFGFLNREDAKSSNLKWFPYNKGGSFRKWFGNIEYFVNFEDDGFEIKKLKQDGLEMGIITANNSKCWNQSLYFKEGITWSALSSSHFGVRYNPQGNIFDVSGSCAFPSKEIRLFSVSFLQSKIVKMYLDILNPTMSFQVGNIKTLPIIFPKSETIKQTIDTLTQECIDISKEEWDSRETSWDFQTNGLLRFTRNDGIFGSEASASQEMGGTKVPLPKLQEAYNAYCEYWRGKFTKLHTNEEELNRLFIDIYELGDELTPEVALKDITLLKSETKIIDGALVFQADEIMKQFISYGVGCMFGRYSLDQEGLVIANMGQAIPTDTSFEIDDDNIIPIVDESDYFGDDITDRFVEFVRVTFGGEQLQQNIAFIENALGKKIRAYFVKDFYKDHTRRYKKRPIYWLFSSAKGTFQTLIYMHRYTPDTCNHILNDYLRPFRIRLDTMRNEAMRITESEDVSTRDKALADKKIDKIAMTLDDINAYEKVLAHYAAQRIEIDLDDGVKVNYCKFRELLYEFDAKLCNKDKS